MALGTVKIRQRGVITLPATFCLTASEQVNVVTERALARTGPRSLPRH